MKTELTLPLINNVTDDTKEAFQFYEDALRHSLPDMTLISSDEFRLLAFIACDNHHFMALRDGKYSLDPAYIPRGKMPPMPILKALVSIVRARVDAIKSGDTSVFLRTNDPLSMPETDRSPTEPLLDQWLREQFPSYLKKNPERIGLSFDEFAAHMLHILRASGDVVKVYRDGASFWRMTRRLRKAIRRGKPI